MTTPTRSNEPLAIIGISHRLPGSADDEHRLWDLLETGRDVWGKVPNRRYNQDSYYHPDPQHAGSMSATGGFFMDRDPAAFDAPFFGIGKAEASALDPQQRYLLESTYECLESAGIPMEKISGTKTGYFCGSFLKDYDTVTSSDFLGIPTYGSVGAAGAFIPNRSAWFFNLKGPSLACDTACSSSLIAFHLACQSIWSGESDAAFAAGTNMIMVPAVARALTQMQFLSPDGRCWSFDDRGNGYGRGEGIIVFLIKPVSAAIRDGDCIRAVVRASASNQNGRTPGITMPSTEAQALLIRTAYQSAGLDLDTTGYFEAHGTGTKIGDPLEWNAIAQALNNETRTSPLIVGSIKSNIGHLEGSAGLAGLLKAILSVERGVITPLARFKTPNPKLRLDDPNLQLATKLQDWPSAGIRRASVNSFGAGGSNAHVIIDDAASYLYTHGLKGFHRTVITSPTPNDSGVESGEPTDDEADVTVDGKTGPRLYVFSSPEQAGLQRMAAAYADFLKDRIEAGAVDDDFSVQDTPTKPSKLAKLNLDQLAQTLCTRRSVHDWKTFSIASSATELRGGLEKGLPKFAKAGKTSGIAFVFSGQGAQYARMSAELLRYTVFRQHLLEASEHLQSLGCTWSVIEELSKTEATSSVDNAAYAQPLSTILQTGLVDLLRSWGIVPKSVVGHSSGEIAAAYAAGALSKQDAWKVAYFRGQFSAAVATRRPDRQGAMLAVGLGEDEASKYLTKVADPELVVACVNSPQSITLSGPKQSIAKVAELLQEDKVYQSHLRVKNAYHSPEMLSVSDDYAAAIADIKPMTGSGPVMFSSVTGQRVKASKLDSKYWVENMLNKVRFTAAVESLLLPTTKGRGRRKAKADIDSFLEVGPHSTLQSAVQQMIALEEEKTKAESQLSYHTVLRRGRNAAEVALEAAGQLWVAGHPVDLARVNQPGRALESSSCPLTDLPAYPWNHSEKNKYWHESPLSRRLCYPPEQRSDFLGFLEDDNQNAPQYRNVLRLDEQPWIADHEIQGVVFLPATAFVVMAIEAAMKTVVDGKVPERVELRDFTIHRPLLFQDRSQGIETRVALKPHKMGTRLSSAPWTQVVVSSRPAAGGNWGEHSTCYFIIHYKKNVSEVEGVSEEVREAKVYRDTYLAMKEACTVKYSTTTVYLMLEECGYRYGPLFRNMDQLYCGRKGSTGIVRIPDTKSAMPFGYESKHVIHPIVLDNALQLTNPSLRYSDLKDSTMLPTAIESLVIDLDVPNTPGTELKGYAGYELRGEHEMVTHIVLGTGEFEKPLITVKNMHCQEVAGIVDIGVSNRDRAKPIATELKWREDVDLISPAALQRILGSTASTPENIPDAHKYFLELTDLQSFKKPGMSVMELGSTGPELASSLITHLSDPGQRTRIDRFVVANPNAKPDWAAALIKQHPGTVDYLTLDIARASADEGPATTTKVDSIVSFDNSVTGENLSLRASKASELLNPTGKFSFTLEVPSAGVEAAKAELEVTLQQAGYSGVDALFELGSNSLFVTTTKLPEKVVIAGRDVLFVEPSLHDSRVLTLMDNLQAELTAAGHTVTRATLETLPKTEDKAIISFIGLGDRTLNQMTRTEFTDWRSMVLRHSGLMWVSAGAIRSKKNPLRAMDTGLFRVVKSEDVGLRIVQFDLSEDLDITSAAAVDLILDGARTSLFPDVHDTVETELTERDGSLLIPRLFTQQAANEAIYYKTHYPPQRAERIGGLKDIMQLHVGIPGMLDTLRFEKPEKEIPTTLAPGHAKVKVQATPINFVDVMVAMGLVPSPSIGCECAGIVVEAHEGGKYKVGDQVVVMTGNAFATHVIEDESLIQPIPAGMSPAGAASCVTIYVTAYVALVDVARIQPGESILIHAGAGGLGQAAIQLAQMIGAEVYVTVGSVAKKNLLMEKYGITEDHIFNSRDLSFAKGIMRQTEQRGVDVILNSTSGEALRQTWHCIAPFGRFLEVGKRDIMTNTGLDMEPFIRNASYSGVHIDQMFGPARKKVSIAMQKVFDLLRAGKVGEVHPITVMTYSQLEEAFRMVQTGKHTGKVVLTQSDDDVVPIIPAIIDKPQLKPDVTYAIAGGLGGVGQSMVDKMFDNGARNFAFFSRTGDAKPEAREYLAHLKRRGANAKAYKADIVDLEALTVAVEQMTREMPPVKGFVNAAMFLQDALLSNMTYEEWTVGIAPKVFGHWNFHNLLPKGLDFFVSLSSISAMIGVPGHANYAAANTYEDAFAFWRRSMGEEAISLNLTAVWGVGVMEYSGVDKSAWFDMICINEVELNTLLGFAMKKTTLKDVPCPTQLTTGVNPTMLNVQSMHWALDPKFSVIRRLGAKRGLGSDDESAKSELMDELQQATNMAAVSQTIEHNLVIKLSKSMMCNPEDINTNKPLHSFGVDSLVAVEIRNWIFKELKSEVTVFDIMDPQPLTALCFKIGEKSKLISAEIKATAKEGE